MMGGHAWLEKCMLESVKSRSDELGKRAAAAVSHSVGAVKGPVLLQERTTGVVGLGVRVGALGGVIALMMWLRVVKVDFDAGHKGVVMRWRRAHIVECHQVRRQVPQPLCMDDSIFINRTLCG